MQTVIHVICQYQHFLEWSRQLRQILESVTTSAKLWPAKRFRCSADRVHTMTLSALQSRCVWSRRNVATRLEEIQWLTVTLPAHLKCGVGITASNEMT